MPLKGVLGYIYIHTYIYILPCPQGVGRFWLDGCGDLIQLWILIISSFIMAGRAGNCEHGHSPAKMSVMLQQKTTEIRCHSGKLPLGPGRDFCQPKGQVESCALRSSSVLVFAYSKAQRQTPIREEQLDGGKFCNGTETAYYFLGQHLLTFMTSNPCPYRSRTGKNFLPHIRRPKDLLFPLSAVL